MGIKKKGNKRRSTKTIGLIDSLFTSTQQKVLGLLFGSTTKKFLGAEIIKLAKVGSGAVQRELLSLTESGLVSVERVSNLKYYQANASSPIFEELRTITLKTMGLAHPLKDALAKANGEILLALVYGSIAKGTDSAKSDIDVLIVSPDLSLIDVYAVLTPLETTLGRKISPTLYTPSEFRKRIAEKHHFVSKVISDKYIPLIGNIGDYAKLGEFS
jgi:predicted nucleotidyltransferase